MGWFAVLICSVLGTAVGLLELAPPGTAAIRRDIAAPPLNLDIAPNVKPSVKLHPAESCVFNGKLYALNELREVPKGIYVCAGKNVWNIKSCAHRGKQIPLMIETRFDNESVVCMQKKLADGTLDFITKRMWPGPAVSAPKPPPAAVPPPVPQPPKKPCPTKVTQAAPTPATPPKLKAEPGKAVTAPPAVPQPPKKPCPTKVTQAAPAPTAPPTLKAEPGKAVTAPPAVPQPPKKPCPTKAQQATVPTVKPVPRPFPLPIVGDYTLPPMKNIPTPPADTKVYGIMPIPIKPCPENERAVSCPGCQKTCANRGKPMMCPMYCVQSGVCVCVPGYYRNSNGTCVPEAECLPQATESPIIID